MNETTEDFIVYKDRPTELIGRKVLISGSGGKRIANIDRVTATQIVLSTGHKLRFTGSIVGDGAWSRTLVELLTAKGYEQASKSMADAKEKMQLLEWLKGRQFTLAELRTIKAALAAAELEGGQNG